MSATYNIPGNINASGGELQNVKLQSLNSAPQDASEARIWWDSVNHKAMCHDGTSAKGLGTEYTFSTGLTNTSGTITVTDYGKLLKNTGLEIRSSLGIKTNFSTQEEYIAASTGIGISSLIKAHNATVVGNNASVNENGIFGTAIGMMAQVKAAKAIQIGYGTNSTASTLSIGFNTGSDSSNNWQLLNGTTGLIPDARLSSNIARTSALSNYIPTSQKGAANGVAELDSTGRVPTSQLPGTLDDVIELLTLSSSAPLTCSAGDMYFNTTSNKIFTATGTDTWGTTGADPVKSIIYVALDTNYSYRWSGSTMINIANPVQAATESTPGIAEIATSSEVLAGTDNTKIVTPSGLSGYMSVSSIRRYTTTNPALTVSNNVVTWTVSTYFDYISSVEVRNVSTGEQIFCPNKITGSTTKTVTIEMLSSANVSAGTYSLELLGRFRIAED